MHSRRFLHIFIAIFLAIAAIFAPRDIIQAQISLFSSISDAQKADITGDGKVNIFDFNFVITHFGAIVPTQPPEPSPTPTKLDKLATIPAPDPTKDHWKGATTARYVMIEFSDFQCPFCKNLKPTLEQILTQLDGSVALVYRHFPLSFHPMAFPAAEASECAAEQGGQTAFWQMHDKIFSAMPNVTSSQQFVTMAGQIGLNQSSFNTCLTSNTYRNLVTSHHQQGVNAGIGATPTIVIRDMQTGEMIVIEGALPFESILQKLSEFIQ